MQIVQPHLKLFKRAFKTMQTVTIMGAGPAGLLLAHYLLSRGQYKVKLYERRGNPLRDRFSQSSDTDRRASDPDDRRSRRRTFPISLQQRGLDAIAGIPGLKAAIAEEGIFSSGTLLHRKKGKPRQVKRKLPLLLINRQQIVEVLLSQLLEKYDAEQVDIQFDCTCVGLDTDSQTITLTVAKDTDRAETFTTPYERLVAADGARSSVRDALIAQADLQCEQSVVPDAYKSLEVPRVNRAAGVELSAEYIHGWTIGSQARLLLVPQPGDTLQGTLIVQPDQNPLAALSSGEDVIAFMRRNCPPVADLIETETAEALLHRPLSRILSVQCDRMHVGDRILLIGDAVHAVSPSIGQGCNAALQDAKAFADCLAQCDDDWSMALPAFTAQRLPEAHALRELSDYSFPRSKPMMVEFVVRAILGRKLGRRLPQWLSQGLFGWVGPMPLSMVMDDTLPYSEVLARSRSWVSRVKRSMAV